MSNIVDIEKRTTALEQRNKKALGEILA